MFEFLATTFIVPFLVLLIITLLKYHFEAFYTAGSDILGFLIALDFASALSFGDDYAKASDPREHVNNRLAALHLFGDACSLVG